MLDLSALKPPQLHSLPSSVEPHLVAAPGFPLPAVADDFFLVLPEELLHVIFAHLLAVNIVALSVLSKEVGEIAINIGLQPFDKNQWSTRVSGSSCVIGWCHDI